MPATKKRKPAPRWEALHGRDDGIGEGTGGSLTSPEPVSTQGATAPPKPLQWEPIRRPTGLTVEERAGLALREIIEENPALRGSLQAGNVENTNLPEAVARHEALKYNPKLDSMGLVDRDRVLDPYRRAFGAETTRQAIRRWQVETSRADDSVVSELDKGIRRFGGQSARSIGGTLEAFGANETGGRLVRYGDEGLRLNTKGKDAESFQPLQPEWWAANIGEHGTRLVFDAGFAVAGAKIPGVSVQNAFAGVAGAEVFGDAYATANRDLLDKGYSPGQARAGAMAEAGTNAIVTAVLTRYLPAEELFGKSPIAKQIARAVVGKHMPTIVRGVAKTGAAGAAGWLAEGGEEVLEGIAHETVAQLRECATTGEFDPAAVFDPERMKEEFGTGLIFAGPTAARAGAKEVAVAQRAGAVQDARERRLVFERMARDASRRREMLTESGARDFIEFYPEDAERLAGIETPSRQDVRGLPGLEKVSRADRGRFAELLRSAGAATRDNAKAVEDLSVEPESQPPAPQRRLSDGTPVFENEQAAERFMEAEHARLPEGSVKLRTVAIGPVGSEGGGVAVLTEKLTPGKDERAERLEKRAQAGDGKALAKLKRMGVDPASVGRVDETDSLTRRLRRAGFDDQHIVTMSPGDVVDALEITDEAGGATPRTSNPKEQSRWLRPSRRGSGHQSRRVAITDDGDRSCRD